MLKKLICCAGLLFMLCPVAGASINMGTVKADLDSVNSSYATISWNGDYVAPPKTIAYPSDGMIDVYWKLRDDSRLAGYKNKVSASVEYFDFSSWQWKPNNSYMTNNTFERTGNNTRTGKYNQSGKMVIAITGQTKPVVKYRITLLADTKGIPTKVETKEFYLARPAPAGNKPTKVLNNYGKWAASRYELAVLFRSIKDDWNALRTNKTSFDFNAEMKKIIMSAASLIGPTSPSDYASSSGMEFLSLTSNMFGNLMTSTALSYGGVIFEAYEQYKWCKDLLASSFKTWDNVLTDWVVASSALAAENQYHIESEINTLSNALVSEADEAARIVYTSPTAGSVDWKTKLQYERDKFQSVASKASSSKTHVATILASGTPAARDKFNNFCDMMYKIANTQYQILNLAIANP